MHRCMAVAHVAVAGDDGIHRLRSTFNFCRITGKNDRVRLEAIALLTAELFITMRTSVQKWSGKQP